MMADSSQKITDHVVQEVQRMTRGNSNQMIVMRDGHDIALNIEGSGVMYFPTSKLS